MTCRTQTQAFPGPLTRTRGAHAPPDWRAMSITDEPHKRHRNNLKPPAKGTPSPNKGKTQRVCS